MQKSSTALVVSAAPQLNRSAGNTTILGNVSFNSPQGTESSQYSQNVSGNDSQINNSDSQIYSNDSKQDISLGKVHDSF